MKSPGYLPYGMLKRHRQYRFDFAMKKKVLVLGMRGVVLTQLVISGFIHGYLWLLVLSF